MTVKESTKGSGTLNNIIRIDEKEIKDHLGEIVRGSVEETLNSLLDAEADALCGATRYERSPERKDTRAGYYNRGLHTKAGKVTLEVPRLRKLPFETAIIERYRRRETSVEEAMIEMYLAGISVRRVEDVTEALWGTRVSPSTVSNLNKKIYTKIDKWLERPIEGKHPYVYLDGLWLKRSWGGEVQNVAILAAIEGDDFSSRFLNKIYANCKIIRKLGEGGFGAVFLGHHASLRQDRAIKILPRTLAKNQVYIARFFKEAQAAASMHHPHITQVFDAGEQDGYHYLIMEFVRGASIGDLMKQKGPVPWAGALRLIKQVLSAFTAAHGMNIIHRDIKPDNILLDGKNNAKVADFGLAKNISESSGLTRTGNIMGTPQYMSPEQGRGEKTDGRTDIYALGATFYSMLTGRPIFSAETPMAVLYKQIHEEPTPITKLVPDTPPQIGVIIHKMLAKDRDERYRTAEEVLEAIGEFERLARDASPQTPTMPLKAEAVEDVRIEVDEKAGKISDAETEPLKKQGSAEDKRKSPLVPIIVVVAVIAIAAIGFLILSKSNDKPGNTGTHTSAASSAATGSVSGKTATGVAIPAGNTREVVKSLDGLIAQLDKALENLDMKLANKLMDKIRNQAGTIKHKDVTSRIDRAAGIFKNIKEKFETYNKLYKVYEEAKKNGNYELARQKLDEARKLKKVEDTVVGEEIARLSQYEKCAKQLNDVRDAISEGILLDIDKKLDKAAELASDEQKKEIQILRKEAKRKEYELALEEVEEFAADRKWNDLKTKLDSVRKSGLTGDMTVFDRLADLVALEETVEQPQAKFNMGSTDGPSREKPVHEVTLDSFKMDKYEVTNLQFRRFMDAGGYSKREYWTPDGWKWKTENSIDKPAFLDDARFNKPKQPVVGVSWYEASAYAKWAGKRLPTEAEWEYTAKSGKDKNTWPWGGEFISAKCISGKSGAAEPMDVMLCKAGASRSGCLHMAGNVWEWCSDWNDDDYYSKSPPANPKGPVGGKRKVVRGGSWTDLNYLLKTTKRHRFDPTARKNNIGFRCASN